MSSKIANILALSEEENASVERLSRPFKSLTEWLSDCTEATKDNSLFHFLGNIGDAAKEWSGTAKALGKLLESFTKERSPEVLGWLAATIAYRKTAEDAVRMFGPPAARIPFSMQISREQLTKLRLEDPSVFETFSMDSAAGHPFLQAADKALVVILEVAGYDPAERRRILRIVRASFKSSMQDVLSEQKDRFAAFVQWLQLDTDDRRLEATLLSYADLQRAELEDKPALGIEPFSISDVYIESECGLLPWKAIRDEVNRPTGKRRLDPFSEESAERSDLMQSVLDLMMTRGFSDCIVVQGAPGAGKSTFTKRLCTRLRYEGLIPIRIPLQHLRVDANVFDGIQDVICRFAGTDVTYARRDLLQQKMFSERVIFGEAEISPYVLIFDGWDEISLSAEEGFQQRVERLLDGIRQTFLNQNRSTVRVLVTGRPSAAVGRANFLLDDTPVLTIRSIRPEQLNRYVVALRVATDKPAFSGDGIDGWQLGNLERYQPVLQQYADDFQKTGALEVLEQPLLAHLAFRVMASFQGDLRRLISPATTLYRHLVDLTCKKGGKHPADIDVTNTSGRIGGLELRALLHGTALATSAHGQESIPSEELELRLETLGVGRDVFQSTKRHPLTNLMISFYFKEGDEDSGCEFLHKSFREYLTAEAIVELLKQYGTPLLGDLPERSAALYWQDFQDADPRRWLIEKLGEVLSPQWLNNRVVTHISEILKWELGRQESDVLDHSPATGGAQTVPMDVRQWERVRDGLADLWDWWGEGVHLRPQPKEKQRLWQFDDPPYAVELVKLAMRRSNYRRRAPPRPPRVSTIDSHLGYALFQLNALVHARISEARGWDKLAEKLGPEIWRGMLRRPRRYQVSIEIQAVGYVQFAPSGASPDYFRNYVLRINGAGVGPADSKREFPAYTSLRGIWLDSANLDALQFEHADMRSCNLANASMYRASFGRTLLNCADLSDSNLFGAHFIQASVEHADFSGANLFATDFRVLSFNGVRGLTSAALAISALGPIDLELPPGVQKPRHWTDTMDEAEEMLASLMDRANW